MSNVIHSLNGWRQRVEVLLHNMVRAEGQEQELADEMSESLEWHTGTMKIPSRSTWARVLDKQRLLAENDFGKLLNLRPNIVHRVSVSTNRNYGMRVQGSAALNEEEIMFWLTLKRSNAASILTEVMAPHVVAAWLDEEERDAT